MATIQSTHKQRAYTREIFALGVAGLMAGVASSLLQLIAHGQRAPLALLAFGSILGLAASFLDHGDGRSGLRVMLGVISGVFMMAFFTLSPWLAVAVGGTLIGAAYSLEHGKSLTDRFGIWLAYGGSFAAAVFTADMLLTVGFLKGLNVSLLQDVVRAGIGCVFMMLPAGLKYMEWDISPVFGEFKAAHVHVEGEHRDFLLGAKEVFERVYSEIEREGNKSVRVQSAQIAEEVARGLIALTVRSYELTQTLDRTQLEALQQRTQELEARVRIAQDASLRRELIDTLQGVVEQMRTRQRFEVACLRLEARRQRYLTALEGLLVTLVQNDSLSSSGEGTITHLLGDLERLTDDVQWQNLSIDALCHSEDAQDIDDVMMAHDEELEELLMEAQGLSDAMSLNSKNEVVIDTAFAHDAAVLEDKEVVLSQTQKWVEDEVVLSSKKESTTDSTHNSKKEDHETHCESVSTRSR